MKLPVPVYGGVPPVADTTTVVVPPKHDIVPGVDDASNCVGPLILPLVTAVQPLASVTV